VSWQNNIIRGATISHLRRYQEPLDKTNELLVQENVIIYEATIQFETFFIRADVLDKTGDQIDLIEVNARSFKSKDEFYCSG